jgi:nucleoside-diphosphate-sugar epimerase
MRILVTGATGFVGAHFVNTALALGWQVVAVRRTSKSTTRVPLVSEPIWITKSLCELSPHDCSDVDVLVHLAAHTPNVPYAVLTECIHFNLTVPLQLFEMAKNAGVQRYVAIGTCFEYGNSGLRYSKIPVNAPLEPTNAYAASKACASIAFTQWAQQFDLSLRILRLFQVYGDGELSSRLWPTIKRHALDGSDLNLTLGEQIRDFSNVLTVAEKIANHVLRICEEPTGNVSAYNIGSGNAMTVRQFSEYWWKRWKAAGQINYGAIDYRPNEVMRYLPDLS